MHKVTNRTQCPMTLTAVDGRIVLPANGSVSGKFDDAYLEYIKTSPLVEVKKARKKGKKENKT